MSENNKNLSKIMLKFSLIFIVCWNNFSVEKAYEIIIIKLKQTTVRDKRTYITVITQ